jgi:D-tyrosyl-tRNA(Tyr) deacylase
MRAVVQRVSKGWVRIGDRPVAETGMGLVVLLGVCDEDGDGDVSYMADKILGLRIFSDDEGKLNLSVLDVHGELLMVSQFTLYGDCRNGRRPSFTAAAPPEKAVKLYDAVTGRLADSGLKVMTGEFQAMMTVGIINEGPVTILIDSKKVF